MITNIFITGAPGVGKTTLIHTLLEELNISAGGFYTQEMRNSKGTRTGFKICTLDGQEGVLADVKLSSRYRVGKYGVNLQDFERIGVTSIVKALAKSHLIVIDEVGEMELFSRQFQNILLRILDSPKPLLGTIMLRDNAFTRNIKKREDTVVVNLTRTNFETVKKRVKTYL